MSEIETSTLINDYFGSSNNDGAYWGDHTDHADLYKEYYDYSDKN